MNHFTSYNQTTLNVSDVEYIVSALKLVTDERVKRETTSAAILQILKAQEDPLKLEKLEKLLNRYVKLL